MYSAIYFSNQLDISFQMYIKVFLWSDGGFFPFILAH